jgi:hypothetical protein
MKRTAQTITCGRETGPNREDAVMRYTFWLNRVRGWLADAWLAWGVACARMRRLPRGPRTGRAAGFASEPKPAAGRPAGLVFSSGPGLMACGPNTWGPAVWTTGDWTCVDWTAGPSGCITITGTSPAPSAGLEGSGRGGNGV